MTDPGLLFRVFFASTVLFAGAISSGGCSRSDSETEAIPRPQAFPRMQLYDTIYVSSDLPAGFEINRSASVRHHSQDSGDSGSAPLWIDIAYPAYGATVSCTFIPVVREDKRENVIANRLQRMSLNIGENFAEQTEMSSPGGYSTIILDTRGSSVTPLQFLSSGREWIISGAMYFSRDSITTDSVRPAIEAVKNDLIHAARRLH